MSTIATLMTNLKTLAAGFKHTFVPATGEEVVFKTVKVYIEKNFNQAAEDLLLVDKPALLIVYGGGTYSRTATPGVDGSDDKAVDRRTPEFVFFIADQEIGFEGKDEAAFGGGTQAKGAAVLLDLWRNRLCLVNPKKDWSIPVGPFVPVDDAPFPVDPKLGDVAVYTLTMRTGFYEEASA